MWWRQRCVPFFLCTVSTINIENLISFLLYFYGHHFSVLWKFKTHFIICRLVYVPHGSDAAAHIFACTTTSHCVPGPPVAKRYYGSAVFFCFLHRTILKKKSLQLPLPTINYERKDKRCECMSPAYDVHAIVAQQTRMSTKKNEQFRIHFFFFSFWCRETSLAHHLLQKMDGFFCRIHRLNREMLSSRHEQC